MEDNPGIVNENFSLVTQETTTLNLDALEQFEINSLDYSNYSPNDEELKAILKQTRIVEDVEEANRSIISFNSWIKTINKNNQIIELLYEKFLNQVNSEVQLTELIYHRNKCMFIHELLKNDSSFLSKQNEVELCEYLIEQIDKGLDEFETAIWAVLALEKLLLDKQYKNYWIDQEKLCRLFPNNRDKLIAILSSKSKNLNNRFCSASEASTENTFQECCTWLLDRIVNPSGLDQLAPSPQTLDTKLRTSHMKLSRDLLSARSDFGWQSAKSFWEMNQIGSYYYEATNFTGGEMRIGLSSKQTFLQGELVGNDECSIGLDGYNQCVWHEGQKWPIKSNRWKVGDIVGCLIDLKARKFKFSLNGNWIFDSTEFQTRFHFSSQPYCAAISLSEHQQVRVNFGLERFKHRPKYLDFLDFGSHYSGNGNQYINTIINTGEMQFKNFNADYSVGGGFSPMRILRDIFTW